MRARLTFAVAALAAAACSSPATLHATRVTRQLPLSEPAGVAGRLAIGNAAPDLPPVKVLQPRLWVRRTDPAALAQVRATKGVAWATPMRIGEARITGAKAAGTVRLAAIDLPSFRPVAPQTTADALSVWHRLSAGEATVAPQTARRLGVALGEPVVAQDRATLRVGAIAPTLTPSIADVLVTRESADVHGLVGEETVLVAIDPKAGPWTVAKRLRAADLTVEVLPDESRKRGVIEPFTYSEREGGMIEIDPAWVARNIVTARVPVFAGVVRCHKLMVPQLRAALQEVADRGLAHLIDTAQYGGCYVPRHIDFDPSKPISMHAWGLAVDFNVSTNGLGQPPQLDQRIVEVFERWGFLWGGRWSRPDGMHFQLTAIVQHVEG